MKTEQQLSSTWQRHLRFTDSSVAYRSEGTLLPASAERVNVEIAPVSKDRAKCTMRDIAPRACRAIVVAPDESLVMEVRDFNGQRRQASVCRYLS